MGVFLASTFSLHHRINITKDNFLIFRKFITELYFPL